MTIGLNINAQLRTLASAEGMLQNPRLITLWAAEAVTKRLRKHFGDRDQTRNRLGGRATHLWRDIRKSTSTGPVTGGGKIGHVIISHPVFPQKLYGGDIKPGPDKSALTIPQTEKSYGLTTRDFEAETGLKLFVLKVGGTKANKFSHALLAAVEDGHLVIEYALVPSVHQDPDPNALPPKEELAAVATAGAEAQIQSQLAALQPPTT